MNWWLAVVCCGIQPSINAVCGVLQVAQMIASLTSERTQFKNVQAATHRRMSYLNLPDSLQKRVNHYFEVLWDRHRCTDTSKLAAFSTMLSVPLQKEVLLALNRDIIKNVSG